MKEKKEVVCTFRLEPCLFERVEAISRERDWSISYTLHKLVCWGLCVDLASLKYAAEQSPSEEVTP